MSFFKNKIHKMYEALLVNMQDSSPYGDWYLKDLQHKRLKRLELGLSIKEINKQIDQYHLEIKIAALRQRYYKETQLSPFNDSEICMAWLKKNVDFKDYE